MKHHFLTVNSWSLEFYTVHFGTLRCRHIDYRDVLTLRCTLPLPTLTRVVDEDTYLVQLGDGLDGHETPSQFRTVQLGVAMNDASLLYHDTHTRLHRARGRQGPRRVTWLSRQTWRQNTVRERQKICKIMLRYSELAVRTYVCVCVRACACACAFVCVCVCVWECLRTCLWVHFVSNDLYYVCSTRYIILGISRYTLSFPVVVKNRVINSTTWRLIHRNIPRIDDYLTGFVVNYYKLKIKAAIMTYSISIV